MNQMATNIAVARTGSDEIGLDPMGLNETDIFMELKPASEWRFASKEALIDAIREALPVRQRQITP